MTKILLVEDDKGLREIYGVRLLAEGYDIISAGDGEEALAMAIKDRPSLIISDVMMPKISGFDMLDILRSTTETRDIKVIMMTALSSEEQRQRGESLGADRYLVKSQVGIEDVVRTVHDVLGDQPSSAPQASSQPGATSFTSGQTPPTTTINAAPPAPVASTISVPARPAAPAALPTPLPTPSQPPASPAPAVPQPAKPIAAPVPPAPVASHKSQTLSERVIQPIRDIDSASSNDFADKMAQELSDPVQVPSTQPVAAPAVEPQVAQQPVSMPPDSVPTAPPDVTTNPPTATTTPPIQTPGVNYEATPRTQDESQPMPPVA